MWACTSLRRYMHLFKDTSISVEHESWPYLSGTEWSTSLLCGVDDYRYMGIHALWPRRVVSVEMYIPTYVRVLQNRCTTHRRYIDFPERVIRLVSLRYRVQYIPSPYIPSPSPLLPLPPSLPPSQERLTPIGQSNHYTRYDTALLREVPRPGGASSTEFLPSAEITIPSAPPYPPYPPRDWPRQAAQG